MNPEIEKRIKLVQAGKVPAGYKLSKVGVIPNEWSLTYLKDVAIHVTEKNKDNAISLTLTNSATKGVIKQTEYFDKQISNKENTDGYFVVQNGDYIYNPRISESAPCGPINRSHLGESGIASPLYTVFRMNSDVHNECYIEMFLKSPFWHRYMCGVANYGARHDRMNITNEDLFSMSLPVPSKREQEKIAEILAAQDRVIEFKEKLIAEKQTQKNYLMDQLFSGQKRLVGKTESFVSSAIGSVPSDWKLFLFETLFDVCKEHTENLIEYPLYSLTIENGVTPKTERYERQHLVKKENVYKILKPKYFAYNPMNIRFGAIGLHKKEFPVAVSGYYDTFTCKDPSILIFMEHFLKSDAMLNYYDKVSTGSLIEKKRVHLSQFLSFELPLPSIEEMRAIAKVLSAADEEISLLQKNLEQEKLKKKSLMQLLLTGLVRVSA